MVYFRHKINLTRIQAQESELNLVTTIPNLDNIRSIVTGKNMTQIAKYNASFRIAQEFANWLKIKKQKDFEIYLGKLMQIKTLLENNSDIDIVTKGPDSDIISTSSNGNVLLNEEITGEDINSSQSSTVSTPSKDFNYSLSNKRIPGGSAPGRKVDKKKRMDHLGGELSL